MENDKASSGMCDSITDPNAALYFAYGSNMNLERMKERKVTFSQRLPAQLTGYEFRFNKEYNKEYKQYVAANIRRNPYSVVHGALYVCTPDVYEKLDVFEGVAQGHYSRESVQVEVEGRLYDAITYIDFNKFNDDIKLIQREYLEHILCGKDLVPPEYYKFLESFSSWCEDRENDTLDKYMS